MEDARIAEWSSLPGLVHGFGRRTEDGAGTPPSAGRLFLMRQVHGTLLATPPWESPPEADAAATAQAGQLLGIKTADCLPILFVDASRRLAAAAHAGWRGTAAGIAGRVLAWFVARGSRPADVTVALGPCIGPCCYEVGDELRAHFAPSAQGFFLDGPGAKPRLDLRGLCQAQLVAEGVRAESIVRVAECTRCHPDRYHSYRRDGAAAGRMISYVGWAD
jgi:polyphenol oxidase